MGDVEQHVCVARYCGLLIPAHWVMCPQDWARLPPELQAELPRAYQERRQWWSRYVRVVGAARDMVDEAMGRVVACGPAGEAASLADPPARYVPFGDAFWCSLCGGLVVCRVQHDDFHRALAAGPAATPTVLLRGEEASHVSPRRWGGDVTGWGEPVTWPGRARHPG
ncbi:hypothetical protein [Streptosporangium sp. NPDC002721]|uniref:hypothetical protein n=1 Tax=Streptosporangium sp. NPDC002721 TaxID=3366188 RepID=UPI0036BE9B43